MRPQLETFRIYDRFEELNHCFTTRQGGVSNGVFASLNLGFNRGDLRDHVLENYKRLAQVLGIDEGSFVLSNQVHKDEIKIVTKADCGKGIWRKSDIIEIDGLMTQEKGVALTTFYADCVPLYFYDPVQKVIALSHAGWRGTVLNIGKKTIEKMNKEFGSNVKDILVAIGPSIHVCCYEVDEFVKKEFDRIFHDDIIDKILTKVEKKPGHYMLDLQLANRLDLEMAGIQPNNIEISNSCTQCSHDRFFSHRAMGNERGSGVAIMSMK